ncbi:MAG: hypothetical protein EOS07_21875 [Mesorhizobium sp.]|nr:MAG: hypothetical protein EOS07_21875 [Mesorhizobium sp.]
MPLVAVGALTISDVNDGLSALLTQEAFVVPTETDGSGGDFALASTTLNVYMGGTDVSAHWQVTALPSVGVTGSLVGRTYTVTALGGDAGYVDMLASRIGYPSLTSRFSISKAKRGAPGKNFSIVASRPGFTFRDGVADPASQIISLTVVRQHLTDQALYFASNGAALETDEGVLSLRGYLHGMPGAGSGDTCYVELEDLGDANEMHVTVVIGEVTQVAHIPRIEMNTGQRGTIQTARAIVGTVWSDAEAAVAITEAGGGSPLRGDVVTLYNTGAEFSQTRVRTTEGAWAALAAFFGGDVLVDGSIIADKIAAQAILSAHIGANQIIAAHIAANQISAGHVTSGAISTQKLLVSGAGNALNPDPAFEDADYWAASSLSGAGSRAITSVSDAYAGSKVMRITGVHNSIPATPNFFAIDPTKTYLLEILAREVVGPTRFYGVWHFRDASGALIPFVANGAWGGNTNNWYFPSAAILPTGGAWTRYTLAVGPNGAAQFPANARFMGFGWLGNFSEAATDVMDFGMVRVSEMGRGELIVDGAITSAKLTTGELITLSAQIKDAIITSAKIVDLSAAKLQAGTALAGTITVSGTALSTVTTNAAAGAGAATNFNANNDRNGTTPTAPVILADGSAVDHVINTDGSASISFEWTYAVSDVAAAANNIDGFIVSVYQAPTASAYVPTGFGANETTFFVTRDNRSFILTSATANQYYTFAVAAYRAVDTDVNATGMVKSAFVKPTLSAENPYRPASTIAFAGDITGTVNGTAAATVVSNAALGAQDPATRVNSGVTKVNPGQVLVSGATTLADWRKGGDDTRIDGGAISANTIDANKLTIGNRNLTFEGLEFESNKPATNRVAWSAGTIKYIGDDGNIATFNIASGSSAVWSTGTLYVYYVKGGTTLAATETVETAFQADRVVLATYKGGLDLVSDYGRTIIDGSHIKTGSIDTAQLKSGSITADLIAAGAVTAATLGVSELSAITANLGTVTAGLLQNAGGTFIIDLTNGFIEVIN